MRNIIVNNMLFKWSYKTYRSYICNSTITIISENRNCKTLIRFKTIDTSYCGSPLNDGMPMSKNGVTCFINLNQPKYIAEIIQYLLVGTIDISKNEYNEIDGNKLLLDLNYIDIENYLR